MKKVLLLSVLFCCACMAKAQQWTAKAPMITARLGLNVAVVNNVIYTLGGRDNTLQITNLNEAYTPATNTWQSRAPMPSVRVEAAVGVVNGKIYVIGGYNQSGALDAVEMYDPVTNTWTTKSPMPTPRSLVSCCVINNKIYVTGGWTNGYTQLEVYDPATNTWDTKAPIPVGVFQNNGGIAVNGKFYVIGGKSYNASVIYSSNYIYDPVTNMWTSGASLPVQAYAGAATTLNGKIHYLGGSIVSTGSPAYDAHYIYDPATNTWSSGLAMLSMRGQHVAATVNNKIYVIGGMVTTNVASPDNYEYAAATTDISDIKAPAAFRLYPNPARNQVTIALSDNQPGTKTLIIKDMAGKNLGSYTFSGDQYTVSISGLPAGLYVAVISRNNSTRSVVFSKSVE